MLNQVVRKPKQESQDPAARYLRIAEEDGRGLDSDLASHRAASRWSDRGRDFLRNEGRGFGRLEIERIPALNVPNNILHERL